MAAPCIDWVAQLDAAGVALVPSGLGEPALTALCEALAPAAAQAERGGMRDLFAFGEIRALATGPALRSLAVSVLGSEAVAVRAILFDKTPQANWKVAWHQDVTIAVRSRHEVPGFGPWSTKSGIPHVQAPNDVLTGMLAIRLHLDDCGPANGPLRVLPGTHRLGKLPPRDLEQMPTRAAEVMCTARRGDVLVMRPLLVHASSAATSPAHRRVVHLEFAAGPLPGGLEWHEAHGIDRVRSV